MADPGFPPVLPFVTTVVTGGLIIYGFLTKMRKVGFTFGSLPFVFGIGILVGFHPFIALLLALAIYWRVYVSTRNDTEGNEIRIFLLTLLVGCIYYVAFQHAPYQTLVLILTTVQFFGALLVITLSNMTRSSVHTEHKKHHVRWTMIILLSVGTLALAAGVFAPLFTKAILFLTRMVTIGIGFLFSPILYLFSLMNIYDQPLEEESMDEGEKGKDEEILFHEVDVDETFIGSMTFYWILSSILLIIVFIILIKKVKNETSQKMQIEAFDEQLITLQPSTSSWKNFKNHLIPNHEVRRQFYKFESTLAKKGAGRKASQTAEDWLSSLPADSSDKETVLQTYDKVRYGNKEVSSQERAHFKKAIRNIMKRVKDGD